MPTASPATARRSARLTTCRRSSGSARTRSMRAPTSTRSACSRIAAAPAGCRFTQPIADAIVHLTSATTTVEADAALRELVAITCRWLAVLALSRLPANDAATNARVRDQARAVIGRDDGGPWLRLARAAAQACPGL